MTRKEMGERLKKIQETLQQYFSDGIIPVEATMPEVLSEIEKLSHELWQLRRNFESMQGVQSLPNLSEEPFPQPVDIAAAALETAARRAKTYRDVDGVMQPVERDGKYLMGTSPIREALTRMKHGEKDWCHPYAKQETNGQFELFTDWDERAKIEIQELMAAAGDNPKNEWYTSDTLTEFDYIIQEIIANLYMKGFVFQSPEQIYNFRFGRTNHGFRISDADRQAICNSVKRLCATTVECNYKAWATLLKVEPHTEEYYSIKGPILHADEIFRTVDYKGMKIPVLSGWRISCIPTIFEHCIKLQRLKKYDKKILHIGGERISERKIAIRDYLMKRLGFMEANAKYSDKILWTTMEQQKGIDVGGDRKIRSRMKEYAMQQLDEWKAAKVIKDWKESDDAAGIIITPNKRKNTKKPKKTKKPR